MILNPEVWGPHYWFVLYSIAISYPKNPNRITKRKYYDFIQNLPLFLPVEEMGKIFSDFLDKYPVTPYLDSRESFIKWIHFIHNKLNVYLGKPEITYRNAMEKYYKHYIPKTIKKQEDKKNREKYIFFVVVIVLIILAIALMIKK